MEKATRDMSLPISIMLIIKIAYKFTFTRNLEFHFYIYTNSFLAPVVQPSQPSGNAARAIRSARSPRVGFVVRQHLHPSHDSSFHVRHVHRNRQHQLIVLTWARFTNPPTVHPSPDVFSKSPSFTVSPTSQPCRHARCARTTHSSAHLRMPNSPSAVTVPHYHSSPRHTVHHYHSSTRHSFTGRSHKSSSCRLARPPCATPPVASPFDLTIVPLNSSIQ